MLKWLGGILELSYETRNSGTPHHASGETHPRLSHTFDRCCCERIWGGGGRVLLCDEPCGDPEPAGDRLRDSYRREVPQRHVPISLEEQDLDHAR